ncbi:hypothetical protein B296_00056686 [Ensete ventricosum]|uniref:Uncharacterized protein n=1 Tax=Ensete ventricosum TaxID=4639 RepID=A0A426WXB4_ENSVE|nr:hypothetical protein B296_00056686 [Ensete ventricosum]
MLSLRFPNTSIRAKIFVRKIGFKLRVIRLNRVESFYALLLHFHSEGSEEEGRPTTARPWPGPARMGGSRWLRDARKGVGCRALARGCDSGTHDAVMGDYDAW